MGWPQWVYIALFTFNIVNSAVKNGQAQKPYSLNDTIIGTGVGAWLLWMGNFFA